MSQPSFMELLALGQVRLEEADDYVDRWHQAPADSEIAQLPLHEYLGMSWEQYSRWAQDPASLEASSS